MLDLWETWGQLDKTLAVVGEETLAVAQARKLSVVRGFWDLRVCLKLVTGLTAGEMSGLGRHLSGLWGQQDFSMKQRGGRESQAPGSTWLQESQSASAVHP